MAISLKESNAISALAQQLYSFLPGSAHPYADQSISFEGIARERRLQWPGGSKLPALTRLLSTTLDQQRREFCPLLIEIVRRGIGYRANKGDPVTREEMRALNDLIAGVGFKVPELIDPAFIDTLPRAASAKPEPVGPTPETLSTLKGEFYALSTLEPQPRGYAFEAFLNKLFRVYGLEPRAPFRVTGEQIDGSLQLDGETYLAEARWRNAPSDAAELYGLHGKVSGKAQWSRGLFIAYSGFTTQGLEAFATGKPTNLICMNGLDLLHVLEGSLDLAQVIRLKARRAAETNDAFVAVRDLFANVT